MYYDGLVSQPEPTGELFAGLGILAVILVILGFLVGIALSVFLIIIPMCKIFKKAGEPWWKAIVPLYSQWVELKFVGLSWYWFIIYLILGMVSARANSVNFVATWALLLFEFNVNYNLAKKFKKSNGFAVLCTLLPFVGLPILGYGKDKYNKDVKVDQNGIFSVEKKQ